MKLYYVMDPMCSWCWGFRPVFQEVISRLPPTVEIQYVMGGLAPDSDEPMPRETQQYVQGQWRLIEEKTGASFNWDFWENCQPRRATYPACRAVMAASMQDKEHAATMIHAIQNAYYQQARNPSDSKTLIALAEEIGLNQKRFIEDLNSPTSEQLLQEDFKLRQRLNVTGFPSLRKQQNNEIQTINIDYLHAMNILKQIF